MFALNKGIVAAQKEYLSNELKCELEQFERDYNTQQDLLKNIINSDCKPGEGGSPNKQFSNCFDNYFRNQSNVPNLNPNDNFEIDEIILAPQLEGK